VRSATCSSVAGSGGTGVLVVVPSARRLSIVPVAVPSATV
jgi:hypothetical protein